MEQWRPTPAVEHPSSEILSGEFIEHEAPVDQELGGQFEAAKVFSSQLVGIINQGGHEAYWTGGCCRDLYLGLEPKDIDLATSASPTELLVMLREQGITASMIEASQAYPIVVATAGPITIEIATFRQETYDPVSQSRHPETLTSGTLEEDAQRRDLTINALYFDPLSNQMVDPTEQGMRDLETKTIRFIGQAEDRILEDRLRLLRAIRFKNRLGFTYAPETIQALARLAPEVLKLSGERVRQEVTKMLTHGSRYQALRDLDQTGMLELAVPEFTQGKGVEQPVEFHSEGDVFEHQMAVMGQLPETVSPSLGWGALLHDIGKPSTFERDESGKISFHGHDKAGVDVARQQVFGRLSFSNQEATQISWLMAQHMRVRNLPQMSRQKQLEVVTHPQFKELVDLLRADNAASVRADGSVEQDSYEAVLALAEQLKEVKELPSIAKDFGLNGLTFIERYQLPSNQHKILGSLIRYLTDIYQNAEVDSREQVLAAADGWMKAHQPSQ